MFYTNIFFFFEVFEEKYTQEFISGKVSKDTQFNYAWSLIRRQNPADIRKGAQLLQGSCHWLFQIILAFILIVETFCIVVLKQFIYFIDLCKYGTDQRDYLYFLAEANYKLSVSSR